MADLTGDGVADLISGSIGPGRVHVFAGDGSGGIKPRKSLKGADGASIVGGKGWYVSVADWDRDGDSDVIYGDISGAVCVVTNVGTRTKPQLAKPERIKLELDDAAVAAEKGKSSPNPRRFRDPPPVGPITETGPCVVDWDKDGAVDLVLGAGDGSVRFYRNVGKTGAPEFRKPVFLIKSCADMALGRAFEDRTPVLGNRSRPCVADWNGDGLPDLIVGDATWGDGPGPQLTEKQFDEVGELYKASAKLSRRIGTVGARLSKFAQATAGIPERGEWSEAQLEKFQDAYERLTATDPAYRELAAEEGKLQARINVLCPADVAHGHVWVFLRRGAGGGVTPTDSRPR